MLTISPDYKQYLGSHSFGPNDAPIFIVLGQSNAYGQGLSTTTTSWANVKMLNNTYLTTSSVYNADPYSKTNVELGSTLWTTASNNLTNLNTGINPNDTTWYAVNTFGINAVTEFATLWQNNRLTYNLPDLYVFLMGKGSQGMYLDGQNDGWSPDRDPLDTASLYHRSIRTLKLIINNLQYQGKNPRIIAVHWNQWEAEALSGSTGDNPAGDTPSLHSLMNFHRVKDGILSALGNPDIDFKFYYPLSVSALIDSARKTNVIKALDSITQSKDNLSYMDIRNYSSYNSGASPLFGIFQADGSHYLQGVYNYVANQEFDRVVSGVYGKEASGLDNITQDLFIVGKGLRIKGDFGSNTYSERISFQNYVKDGNTFFQMLPNGTSTVSGLLSFNNSNPANAGWLGTYTLNNTGYVEAGKTGTGTSLNLVLKVNSIDALTVSTGGYTKIGNDAPSVKMKKISGTTSSSQGTSVSISHGLTASKILGVQVLVNFGTNQYISNSWAGSSTTAGYSFSITVDSGNIVIWNDAGNSSNILSKSFTALITYEE